MIGSIKGKTILKTDKFIIVEANGVGYKIHIHKPLSFQERGQGVRSDEIFLWIHTIVREDALDLYGFLDREELEFFEMLISVSGIGPKGALGILSVASIETLRQAIGTNDISYLTKISGIGRKTAEKIVIELRDKFKDEKTGGALKEEMDALEALKSLGYSQNEARDALKNVTAVDTNAKIKEALKILGGK
ncbi:MAG: Holliday junction branch migration protein RuvA [Candidatus Nomurabacteria bacterium]|nr:Holliday junction branch migration protein RuvA [Candidatus Nomurabacteria bacterium]